MILTKKQVLITEKINEHVYIILEKDVKDNRFNENDEIAYKHLKNDKLLLASFDDCYLLENFNVRTLSQYFNRRQHS